MICSENAGYHVILTLMGGGGQPHFTSFGQPKKAKLG